MKKYTWRGIDAQGKNRKGTLSAHSQENLKDLLLKQKIALLDCKLEKEAFLKNFFSFSKGVNKSQKAFFFGQLAILVSSGVELLKALKLVSKQIKSKKLKDAILQITDDVSKGDSLSKSMQKHNSIFDSSMVYVVRAGENSGKLGFVLQSLANYLNDRLELIKKLKYASLLPCITIVFALFIVFGIFIFVIPQFESLFVAMDQPVPDSTKIVMKISLFLRSQNAFFCFLIFISLLLFLRVALCFDNVKKLKDKFVLHIYFLNKIFLLFDLISFLQILSMFLRSGVPLKEALELGSGTVKNSYFKEKISIVLDYVVKGQSLENALEHVGEKFFPDNLLAVVSVGEHAGNLDLMLQKAADFFQEELRSKLQVLTTIFQPALMIIIGLLIVFLMLSVYLPIFNMASLV